MPFGFGDLSMLRNESYMELLRSRQDLDNQEKSVLKVATWAKKNTNRSLQMTV